MKNNKLSIIKKTSKIFDILVNQETALSLINENHSLKSCYVLLKSVNQNLISSCLRKGVKKFVFTDMNIFEKSKLNSNVVALLFSQKLSSVLDISKIRFSEFIITLDSNQSEKKQESFIKLEKNDRYPSFLLISQFKNEELTYVKKFDLKPIIDTTTNLEIEKIEEFFLNLIDFENKGLIPTIVKDDNDIILMQAYSNQESLKKTFKTNLGSYYSRSREKIWVKGETSGNFQSIQFIKFDCDFDSLVFTVEQEGVACHLNSYSCFNYEKFNFQTLYSILKERIIKKDENSYTYRISQDEKRIMEKIQEECSEVVNYSDENNLVWEISDLFYFLHVLMAKKGINVHSILNELRRRNLVND